MRYLMLLAVVFLATVGRAEPERTSYAQDLCGPNSDFPCVLGVPPKLLETCEGAPDAALWPFVRLHVKIGQPDGPETAADWLRSAAEAFYAAHGLRYAFGDLPIGARMIEGWDARSVVARGWAPGDAVALLVPLTSRSTEHPENLPLTHLPVFCDALGAQFAVRIGSGDLAGTWTTSDRGRSCSSRALLGGAAGERGRLTTALLGGHRDVPTTMIFGDAGKILVSQSFCPRCAGVRTRSKPGPERILGSTALFEKSYWLDGQYLWLGGWYGGAERYVVTRATQDLLELQISTAPAYLRRPRTFYRCQTDLPPSEIIERGRRLIYIERQSGQ